MKFDFVNSEGHKLSGRLELPQGEAKTYALFAHCFTCSKDVIAASVISRQLTLHGIGVLRFDFTGLGNSEGDFANTNFSSNVNDLIDAFNAIKEHYDTPTILIGHSLGGAAVLKAAPVLEEIKSVVTIGAPSEVDHVSHLFKDDINKIEEEGQAEVELAGRKFTIKKQFIDDIKDMAILDCVKSFKKSLLVMHSPIDNTVSVDHAANIFIAAKHPKSFVSLDTADHLLMNRKDARYAAETIAAWVTRYVDIKSKSEKNNITVNDGELVVTNRPGKKFTHDVYTKTNHIVADEPLSVQGDDLGLNPYELLLAGLGGCTAMTMRMYADRKGIQLEEVEVRLTHRKIHASDCQDCETQEGKVDRIDKYIKISGQFDEAQKAKLLEIAEKCPVNRTLKSEISIQSHHIE